MQQRSAEWMAARLGKITSSRFCDVLTQPRSKAAKERGELSLSARGYMLDLVAETVTGKTQGPPLTRAMQHGIDHEPIARRLYQKVTGRQVQEVGFIAHPSEALVGCSPDGLISYNGGIEIKCPEVARIHFGDRLYGHERHKAQIQGAMWITGRKWWDFVSYHSATDDLGLALYVVRDYRDDEYIGRLVSAVRNFRARLEETIEQLREAAA